MFCLLTDEIMGGSENECAGMGCENEMVLSCEVKRIKDYWASV